MGLLLFFEVWGFKMCIGTSSRVYSLRTELEPLQGGGGGGDSNLGKGISLHPLVFICDRTRETSDH